MTASERRRISVPSVIAPMLVFVLLGCTPMGYFKSGSTDEQVKQDLTDCTEIARHQAFRDQPSFEFGLRLGYGSFNRGDRFMSGRYRSSSAELQHRYRRVCMIARGYELTPLEDQK